MNVSRPFGPDPGNGFRNGGDCAKYAFAHRLSDEPEQSSGSTSGWIEDILELAPTSVISAVAGPVPGGCATAEAGTGYDEAAEETGGFFANFCEVDWTSVAESLAGLSLGEITDTFALSEQPWEETIVVLVDGEVEDDWRYDAEANSVVFSAIPADGSGIVVSYSFGECDEVATE